MPFIVWQQAHSVSQLTMDDHHRQIFALINMVHDAVQNGRGDAIVSQAVTELRRYADMHFTAEEQLLAQRDYERLDEQRREHAFYLGKIAEMDRSFAAHRPDGHDLLRFIKQWIIGHILKEDMRYAELFENRR